ncbi:MAG: PEP-CTERM sorting domain-containing protein [Sedimentisphaerales bacterium]
MNSEEMRKSRLSIGMTALVLFVLVVFSAQAAFADPVWSGPGTTFQEWTFPTDQRTNVAPNGTGDLATVSPGNPSAWIGKYADRINDTWALVTDEMDFYIPNYNTPNPEKDMEIVVDWKPGSGNGWPNWPKQPLLSVYPLPGTDIYPEVLKLSDTALTNGQTETIFRVIIRPNPMAEWVVLKGDVVVSQVAISTICIPEPATIGLFIGGAFLAFRRSRNRYGKKQIIETVGDMNF